MTIEIDESKAEIIITSLASAGWLDDADELFADMIDNGFPDEVILDKAKQLDELVEALYKITGDKLPRISFTQQAESVLK